MAYDPQTSPASGHPPLYVDTGGGVLAPARECCCACPSFTLASVAQQNFYFIDGDTRWRAYTNVLTNTDATLYMNWVFDRAPSPYAGTADSNALWMTTPNHGTVYPGNTQNLFAGFKPSYVDDRDWYYARVTSHCVDDWLQWKSVAHVQSLYGGSYIRYESETWPYAGATTGVFNLTATSSPDGWSGRGGPGNYYGADIYRDYTNSRWEGTFYFLVQVIHPVQVSYYTTWTDSCINGAPYGTKTFYPGGSAARVWYGYTNWW